MAEVAVAQTCSAQASRPRWPAATTAVILTLLAIPACRGLVSLLPYRGVLIISLGIALIVVSGVGLVVATGRQQFPFALSIYWAWSFVFVGVMPAYQLMGSTLPWGGRFANDYLAWAQMALLIGHLAVIVGFSLAARGRTRARLPRATGSPGAVKAMVRTPSVSWVVALLVSQVAAGVLFTALMGPGAMSSGKAAFQSRLLQVADIPGGATLYFLATASAVVVAPAALLLRRRGLRVPGVLVASGLLVGFVVTNPLIGSRFLTGSFLIALAGVVLSGRSLERLLPVGAAVALITIFPSLDLWRGISGGAQSIVVTSPVEAAAGQDFDAFEMLVRALFVRDMDLAALPSPVVMVLAAVLRWVPFAGDIFAGNASGSAVAAATGMSFRNVSMPLWGEGYLMAGPLGTFVVMGLLGAWMGIVGTTRTGKTEEEEQRSLLAGLSDASTGALLFILLRGSMYEVLDYLLLAVVMTAILRATSRTELAGLPQQVPRERDGTRTGRAVA